MAKLTAEQKELYKKLMDNYGLNKDHFFTKSTRGGVAMFTIITRHGIEKIKRKANIKIVYDVEFINEDTVVLKGTGYKLDEHGNTLATETTFASASAKTATSAYYAELAEKRCMSRLVLQLEQMYEEGVFGEDESTDFSSSSSQSAGISIKS